jgi:hypothetical protein
LPSSGTCKLSSLSLRARSHRARGRRQGGGSTP